MKQSMGRRERLSFAGWKMNDESTSRLVRHAYALKELDMYVFNSPLFICFILQFFLSVYAFVFQLRSIRHIVRFFDVNL